MAVKESYFWPDIAGQRRFLDKTAKELHIKTVTLLYPTSSRFLPPPPFVIRELIQ